MPVCWQSKYWPWAPQRFKSSFWSLKRGSLRNLAPKIKISRRSKADAADEFKTGAGTDRPRTTTAKITITGTSRPRPCFHRSHSLRVLLDDIPQLLFVEITRMAVKSHDPF